MAGPPLTSPWAPPEGRLRDAFRIADMIRDTGMIEAQGKYNKRLAISDLIGGVADTAFGAIEANQQKKALQEIGAILSSGQPFDAQALVSKYGIKATKEAYSLYAAMQPKQGEPFTLGEGQTRYDAKGNVIATGKAKEPTEAEKRAAEKYEKDARAETVDEQMRTWADEALRSGATPSDVQSQYYRETGKAYPLAMNPETPNQTALAIRAANGDPAAKKALELLNPNSGNLNETELALKAAGGDPTAIRAMELLRAQRPEAQGARPPMQWAKGPDGVVRLMTHDEIRSLGASQPDTADMRNKASQVKTTSRAVDMVRGLGARVITKIGPAQRADALKRGAAAVFGSDAEFKTYQDSRMALAGALAVEQQGSRPSDTDLKQVWLPMIPDAYSDTRDSRILKWQMIDGMRGIESAMDYAAIEPPDPAAPAPGTVNPSGGWFGTRTRRGAGALGGGAPAAPVAPPVAPPAGARRGNEPRRRGSVPPVAVPVAPPPTVGALVAPQAAPPPPPPPPPVAPPREGFARSYDTAAPAQIGPQVPPRTPVPPPPEVVQLLADQPAGVHELSDGSVWRKMPNGTLLRMK